MAALIELRKGSFRSPKTGALAWWRAAGRPPIVLVTDPPYTGVKHANSTKKRAFKNGKQAISRPISYGALDAATRNAIAQVAAVAEWSAVYDVARGVGLWADAIDRFGGVFLGAGSVLQTRGAPRLRGDGPGVRELSLILARRKGAAKWAGRKWAEWMETRPVSTKRRPIPGTRSLDTMREIIRDLVASCRNGSPIVVDPCAGTGVTLIAAKAEGLSSIGWERDPKTHAWALDVIRGMGETIDGHGQIFQGVLA